MEKDLRFSFSHVLVCSVAIWVLFSCNNPSGKGTTGMNILYPTPLPDSIPIPFLPGIVSGDSLDFNSVFSPDGKSFYFSRTENNQSHIYTIHHNGQNWNSPTRATFSNSLYSDADPTFGVDGKLYFISNRPKDQLDSLIDFDIWFVNPSPQGDWEEPINLGSINSDSSEFYISFTKTGNLYFASSRAGGFGAEDIYVSKWDDGQYSTPVNLGNAINSQKSEYDPCISINGDFIIYTSTNREDTFGKGDLYGSTVDQKGAWSQSFNLGKDFNTKSREFCAYITPDSKYFFFSSEGNVKWMDAKLLLEQFTKRSK